MSFLCRNLAVFHVAFVCAFFVWLFGGTRGEFLVPTVPWVIALMLEGMICFPQRRSYETTYDARKRVWYALSHDPLTLVSFLFILVLSVPFLNTGLCLVCDYPAIDAGADPSPTIPFAPFCVRRMDHLNVYLWFVPSLLAMLATKHALLKSGKRLLLKVLVWNGVVLAFLGAIQQMTDAQGPFWLPLPNVGSSYDIFYATFGYPNMAGDLFTTLFGIAAGLWRWDWSRYSKEQGRQANEGGTAIKARNWFWRKHRMLIPSVILFLSAINTLSRAAMLLVSAMAIVIYLHTFFGQLVKLHRLQRFKTMFGSLIVFGGIIGATMIAMPKNIQKELDSLSTSGVLDRITGKGQYHVRIATEIWQDYPLFGCGGWGYKHFCWPKMTDEDRRSQQMVGGINVHNDHLQFLAEHGLVGFGLLLTIGFLLIKPVFRTWKYLIDSVRFLSSREQPATPVSLFVLPAPVFCIFLTTAATIVHAFADCPMRSPAVLSLFFVSLAAMDGFLPALREDADDIPES